MPRALLRVQSRLIRVPHTPPGDTDMEYRGTSLIRNNPPVGPYRRPMHRALLRLQSRLFRVQPSP